MSCRQSVSEKSFETLWIENGTSQSPAAASVPSQVRSAIPNWSARTRASAGM
jgi:hypothetical protein